MEEVTPECILNGHTTEQPSIDSCLHNECLVDNVTIADIPQMDHCVTGVGTNLEMDMKNIETVIGVRDTHSLHLVTIIDKSGDRTKEEMNVNGSDVLCVTDLELSSSRDYDGFNTSDLNVTVIEVPQSKSKGNGSDSGVESTLTFHRTFSCNSGGYSSGGLDDLNKSCDSSLLSYSEDTELMTQSLTLFARDGTSEGGSESSALDSDSKSRTPIFERNGFSNNRRVAPKSNEHNSTNGQKNGPSSITDTRQHTAANRRQNITPRRSGFSTSSPRTPVMNNTSNKLAVTPTNHGASSKNRSISNLEKGHINFKNSPSDGSKNRTPSGSKPKIAAKPTVLTPRPKTPKTEYDGRWPSSTSKTTTPHKPRSAEKKLNDVQSSKPNTGNIESKATALDRYGTLPRRSRRRSPETGKDSIRSFSVSREQSISRVRRNVREVTKTLPPFPRRKPQKTRIYHETGVQTALTSLDVEKALEGVCFKEPRLDIEYQDQEVQVDRTHEVIERLELELKMLRQENSNLKEVVVRQKECVGSIKERLAEEKSAKDATKEELHNTEKRLQVMLGKANDDGGANSLQELESHIQTSGKVVIRQQKEIINLQSTNRSLHQELEKIQAAQKLLLQQQKDAESESIEMQEFLQEEKSMLTEALIEAEREATKQKELVAQKLSELDRKQDECNHLVRINEQRKQENMTLQGRINGLDERSKDLLLQQGAAVSGAAVALSGLSSRLDGLVEQLVSSYDISEKDLEDVIFHNEAYSKSNSSSAVASPEKTQNFHQPSPSPKRRASFLTAVVKAIRNATNQSPFSKRQSSLEETGKSAIEANAGDEYEKDSNKDSNVVEKLPGENSESQIVHSESLANLSQAILNRQHFEDESEALNSMDGNEMHPESGDFSPGTTFIDQIIEVDNLVTRLLKVLRIIQLETDANVDELQDERIRLEEEVRRERDLRRADQEELRSLELVAARLRGEVQEAKLQLDRRVTELEETQADLTLHTEQVRMLSNENRKLSSALSLLQNCDDEAKGLLQKWQESGDLPSPDSIGWMLTAHTEIPALKEQLAEKEYQLVELGHKFSANKELLSQNLHQAAEEIRRQYEAIDSALEILQSIQGVVHQCPPLAKLQRELEETNFQCASLNPIIAADLNANASPMSANDIHNVGLDVVNNPVQQINGAAY